MFILLGVGCLLALARAQVVPNPPRSVSLNSACNGQADCVDTKMICAPPSSGQPNQCLCPSNIPSTGSYCGVAAGDSCVNSQSTTNNLQCNDNNAQCTVVANDKTCLCRQGFNQVKISTSGVNAQPQKFCAACAVPWITYTGWMIGSGVRLDYFEYTSLSACQTFCLQYPGPGVCTGIDVQTAGVTLCWITTDPPATLDGALVYNPSVTHYRITTACSISTQPGVCVKVTSTPATALAVLPQNAILMTGVFNVPNDCATACLNTYTACTGAIVDQRFNPLVCYAGLSTTATTTPFIAGDTSFVSYTPVADTTVCTSTCMGSQNGFVSVTGPGTYNPSNLQSMFTNVADCQTACVYSSTTQPSTCAGVEFVTTDTTNNPVTKCYFLTAASFSGALTPPPTNLQNTIFKRFSQTCMPPCTNIWSAPTTATSAVGSSAAILISDPAATSGQMASCQTYCSSNIAGCKAVEYGTNSVTNQAQCYVYTTAPPTVARTGFSIQSLLLLCPGQGPCVQSILWAKPNSTNYGTVMSNPQVYASASTMTDCQNACLNLTAPATVTTPSNPYCYGIELDSSYAPPVCRLYTNPTTAIPTQTLPNLPSTKLVPSTIQQMMLLRVCKGAYINVAPPCDLWTAIDSKPSMPPQGSANVQSKAYKFPNIGDAGKCRDFCTRVFSHCLLAEFNNNICYVYLDTDWTSSQSFEDTRYKTVVASGPQTISTGSLYVPALPRCPVQRCLPKWQSMPRVQSWGGTLAPSTANIRTAGDCLNYCIVARGCVAVDFDISASITCWLHFVSSNLLTTNLYSNKNVTQYRIKRCPQDDSEYCMGSYAASQGMIVTPTAGNGITNIPATTAATRIECQQQCEFVGLACVGYSYTDLTPVDLTGMIVAGSCNLYGTLAVMTAQIAVPAAAVGSTPQKTDTLMTKTSSCAKYCMPQWTTLPNMKFTGTNLQTDSQSLNAQSCLWTCVTRPNCIAVSFDETPGLASPCSYLTLGQDVTQIAGGCSASTVYILLKKCGTDCTGLGPQSLTSSPGRYKLMWPTFYDGVVDVATCQKMCNLDPACNIVQFTTTRSTTGNPPTAYTCASAEIYDPVSVPDSNPPGAVVTTTTQAFLYANFARCSPTTATTCTPLWANVNSFKSMDSATNKLIQPSNINNMQACQMACLANNNCVGVEMGPLTGTTTPTYCALHVCTAAASPSSCNSMTSADTTPTSLSYWTQSYLIRRCPPASAAVPAKPNTPAPMLNAIG